MDQREQDTKVLIDLLDLLKETRRLRTNEAKLRLLAVQGLQDIHSRKP